MAELKINHTIVLDKTLDAFDREDIRFIIHQGGSRSGKTYSLMQMMIIYCLTHPGKLVSIIRKTFPTLRSTVMREFFDLLKELELYDKKCHNKTNNIYEFSNGSKVEFFGADNGQKLRGRKRDVLWLNESNELNFDEFTQLNMRTTEKLVFDFNPSDNFHWLYDLIERENATLIKSTYLDNPFLPKDQANEIANLINIDESYYRIYALGEKGVAKTTIYTHWRYYEKLPEIKETIYGLDFGHNHPTALVEVNITDDGDCYVREIIYKSHLTVTDLLNLIKDSGISKNKEIICDSARPEIIEDIRRIGYNAKGAIKNVKEGIDSVKSVPLFIHKESSNLIKEINSYKWKTNGEIVLDEPVKLWDDAVDALRYSIHWWKVKTKKNNPSAYRIRY